MSLSEDPPVKSWDLEFHLAVAAVKVNNNNSSELPIEQVQKRFNEKYKIEAPPNIILEQVILDERYRQESRKHLEKVLKQYEDVLDEKWKEPNDRLHGEWVYTKDENNEMDKVILHIHGGGYFVGSPESFRGLTFKYAEYAKARVFSIDYRLAPQNQFPASLCDSVAAYLYLLNPGLEAGFKPINPKKIVFMGESAGGGLALATLLFLRDAELPLPGGAVVLSPWVDLTQSMPSYLDAEIDKADYIDKKLGIRGIGSSSSLEDEFNANVKALADKIAQKKPKIVGHPSFTEVPRFNLYCANEAIAIPYISPMLAESLGDLPPILCQVGGLERFRDEGILFSYKAAYPHEYQLPSYATKNFEKSPFKNPTKVILEVYDDMPHAWHVSKNNFREYCFFLS
ncbi:Alpha/Beta hydrolase protein [Gigaspora rosea]|uniref:Alpha/Beta hydrolase protein n=1 Tax=Gigaspora rosea TaxID=44941 RepID=A0A397VG38_9GLOM|nr:Alpha/Beta hydrolase protein [Gigaspora rosea]